MAKKAVKAAGKMKDKTFRHPDNSVGTTYEVKFKDERSDKLSITYYDPVKKLNVRSVFKSLRIDADREMVITTYEVECFTEDGHKVNLPGKSDTKQTVSTKQRYGDFVTLYGKIIMPMVIDSIQVNEQLPELYAAEKGQIVVALTALNNELDV